MKNGKGQLKLVRYLIDIIIVQTVPLYNIFPCIFRLPVFVRHDDDDAQSLYFNLLPTTRSVYILFFCKLTTIFFKCSFSYYYRSLPFIFKSLYLSLLCKYVSKVENTPSSIIIKSIA
jgi:hypothetical protein